MTNIWSKKNPPKNRWGLMWVSNHTLVTNSGRASVTSVPVCTSMRTKSPSAGRENSSKLIRRRDKTETNLVVIWLRRPRPAVCCGRSKPMTNKLPWLAGGLHCIIKKTIKWPFTAACIIKRMNTLSTKSTQRLHTCKLQIPLARQPHLQKQKNITKSSKLLLNS